MSPVFFLFVCFFFGTRTECPSYHANFVPFREFSRERSTTGAFAVPLRVLSRKKSMSVNVLCDPPKKRVPFPRDLSQFRFGTKHQVKCFAIPLNSKLAKKLRINRLLYADWLTNMPRFQRTRPDHVRVQSSCCCFPRELVSFVRP